MRRSYILSGLVAAALPVCVFAESNGITITPVASVLAGGGRYVYSDSASNGGSFDLYLCPVVNFDKNTALLPMYFGSYRGTKDVRELVGGGTLTQETQSHAVTLRFVGRMSDDWRVRARAGYKLEMVKETADETWGAGLFDHARVLFGAEAQRSFERSGDVRFGADYYTMSYPNYRSLVTKSEFETSLDTTTYSEISTNAGRNPLDNSNIAVSASYTGKTHGESFCKIGLDVILKSFADQKVVAADGSFTASARSDTAASLSAGYTAIWPRLRAGVYDTFGVYSSNQNSFDAGAAKYIPGYYNYAENTLSPSLTFIIGGMEPFASLGFFVEITGRYYRDRPSQTATGDYTSDRMYQSLHTAGVNFSYPLRKDISARVSSSYRAAESNNKYEGSYKYNYGVTTYFAGVNWEL